MEKKYKYRYDRRCRRITAALLLILAGLFVWFHFVLGGDYLPAWGLFFVQSAHHAVHPVHSALHSAGRRGARDPLHRRPDADSHRGYRTVRRIERANSAGLWPLLGSYGFWGYYGYYFSFREWTLYNVAYAAERNNLVLIEDIYEDTYIVSCDDPDG